jgi:hypothetical protein
MKTKTLKFMEWEDVREYLCEKMDIKVSEFRKIGRDYWHIWLYMNQDINNDVVLSSFLEEDESYWVEEFGEWVAPFIQAIDALREELGGNELYIRYRW